MEQANAPAFPTDIKLVNRNDEVTKAYWGPGLTKREYFAGLAMQGMLANPNLSIPDGWTLYDCALDHADALITALEK